MPLRRRVGMAAAIAVAIAVVLVAGISYFVVRHQLRSQVDDALRAQAVMIQENVFSLNHTFPTIPASAGGPAPYIRVVAADGTTVEGNQFLPVNNQVSAVAAGAASGYLTDVHVGDSHLREFVFKIPAMSDNLPLAVMLARPLNEVDNVLSKMRLILLLVSLGAIALAAALGRLAARRVLAPLAEVADTAQHISRTEDLGARLRVRSDDEVGQLASRFNTMLERLQSSRTALDESVHAQRQLVADASHELRTPVTSLRTNIELLLADEHQLSDDERRQMLADVVEQSEELSQLVGDLIELGRGDLPAESFDDVELDQVVAESVDRARRNFPGIRFQTSLAPVIVEGAPERLGRAVNNLLDNAARHSPDGGIVEVTVAAEGGVSVRDHGHGVDKSDLPFVFDRFYRGAGARGRQGSGLGLAIVRQVAEQHHGSVSAANAPDGGAVFTIRLPVINPEEPADLPPGNGSGAGRPDDPSLTRGPEALA